MLLLVPHTHILLVLTAKKELSSWMAPSSSLRSKLHKAGAAAALSWLTIHDRQTRHLVASPLELVGRRHLHSVPLHWRGQQPEKKRNWFGFSSFSTKQKRNRRFGRWVSTRDERFQSRTDSQTASTYINPVTPSDHPKSHLQCPLCAHNTKKEKKKMEKEIVAFTLNDIKISK